MKVIARLLLPVAALLVSLRAADPLPNAGETSLNLSIAYGIRYVPDSRVAVPVGEMVRINSDLSGDYIRWYKNGALIPKASEPQLVLPSVTPADAGIYTARNENPAALSLPLTSIHLSVGGFPTRLINSSTRAVLGPDREVLVGGFVFSGADQKKVIIRAVGPSLSIFGVPNPLARPVIRIFDGQGKPYTNAYVYLPMVGAPTYESDLRESSDRAGAFPLPAGSADAVEMRPFKAGSYTVHVTSADGAGGTVLLEIYEVP